VKIQHPDLKYGCEADRAAITWIVAVISKLFDGFDYVWLTNEMNKNLPLELNFVHEAGNMRKCQRLFQSQIRQGSIAIPRVNESLSSSRVLTMTFEEGVYVTEVLKIREMGLDERAVAKSISRIFCDQM
jgi:aarF domain-containing kinase